MNGTDAQFDRVIEAFANYNRTRERRTPEQIEADRIAAHKRNPKHVAALARRRKRKRGGHK